MMNFTVTDAQTLHVNEDVPTSTKRGIVSSDVHSPRLIAYEQTQSPVLPSLSSRRFADALESSQGGCQSPARSTDSHTEFTPPKCAHRIGSYIVSAEEDCVGRRRATSAFNPGSDWLDCFTVNARDAQRQIALRVHLDEPEWLPSVVDTLMVGQWTYFFCVPTYGSLLDEFGTDCVRGMEEQRVADIFGQIVDIVSHCHGRGVVLRDLTLRCFAFEDEARTTIKLLSMDHADLEDVRRDRFACRFYACPEMFVSNSTDPKAVMPYSGKGADVWSLGVICYSLLVGCYPFFDHSRRIDLCTIINSSKLRLPLHLSGPATQILLAMLERNPEKRLTAAALSYHPFLQRRRPAWTLGLLSENSHAAGDQRVPTFEEGSLLFPF